MKRDEDMDLTELTIPQYHSLLRTRQLTCLELTTFYLSRIHTHNPTLKALISITPESDCLDLAQQKDLLTQSLLTSNTPFPPLHGVPLILKDTYSTAPPLRTTSGVRALSTLQTSSDSRVVSHLRAAGALILGKANLHEFSLQGLTLSSLGGQTLNPYDASRTPGGSSGGTAVAVAANLCLVGCGGDTMNSLRSPASACAVVGFRPSTGVVSTWGVMGVSMTQDALGPMGRCVADVRVVFGVMRGEERESLSLSCGKRGNPLRIGVLESYFGEDIINIDHIDNIDESDREEEVVTKTILRAIHRIRSNISVEFVKIPKHNTLPGWSIPHLLATTDTQSFEFRSVLNNFLQSPLVESTPHRTLESIVHSGEYHHDAVTDVFYNALRTEMYNTSPSNERYRERLDRVAALKTSVDQLFAEYMLDALVYPHQTQLVVKVGEREQKGRNGVLAALTGRPAVCFPAGFSPPTSTAPKGIPIGIELMGKPGDDEALLDIAEMFEGVLQARRQPDLESLE